ncbi:hypothetical protein HanLR1_Chr16g0613151 [Helianthus annuus]|nr:hypothetical protein HanLR1_Chr16g0613151 [Helianthus annuus]
MTHYATFFRERNFRLPMSKLLGEILTRYGLHILQVNALGLPRVTDFEFICQAQKIEPTFEMFNVFITSRILEAFTPSTLELLVFFHAAGIHRRASTIRNKSFSTFDVEIPIDMHYRAKSEGVPKVAVSVSFADQEWYKTQTRRPTLIIQLEEKALVAAGMSLPWVPREPRAFPVYAYKGKGYSLMNVLDPKVAGEIATTLLPVRTPAWTARIRDNFLHPSSEDIAAYGTMILGAPSVAQADVGKSPTREGTILLSSEESTNSSQ